MLESLGNKDCAEYPKYYSFMAVMSLIAVAMLVQVSHLIKLGLMVLVVTATGAVNIYSWRHIYDLFDYMQFASYRWEINIATKFDFFSLLLHFDLDQWCHMSITVALKGKVVINILCLT